MALPYSKLCQLADFESLSPWMTEAGFPWVRGREERKQWEIAMALRTFDDLVGISEPRALGVGAGVEHTTFWLTNRCREVHATDLYARRGTWRREAPAAMLLDPAGAFDAIAWRPRRLVVQHMDARALRYEDESFDFAYSSSSLEHFGTFDDAARALGEVRRVLKPGGVFSVSTEFRLRGPGNLVAHTLLFDAAQVQALVEASGLRLHAGSVDLTPDPGAPVSAKRAMRHIRRTGGLQEFPHLVLELKESLWTSIHLALVRDS